MIDNYIKVHTRVPDGGYAVLPPSGGIHPEQPLSIEAQARIASAREGLASDGERSHYLPDQSDTIVTWVFPFDSASEESIEPARLDAHKTMTELVACGCHPVMTAFRPMKALALRVVGEPAIREMMRAA